MEDKTCVNCFRILTKPNQQKFCNYNCYVHHTKLMDTIKKQKEMVEREKNRWKNKKIGLCKQFYETFWEDHSCMICGNFIEEGDIKTSFLHIRLKKGTEDLDEDSFQILCSECYLKINKLKDNPMSKDD